MVDSFPALLRRSRFFQRCLTRWPRLAGPTELRPSDPISVAAITLEPEGRCPWDKPVRIAVCGLAPGQRVTLRASLRDEKGALFRAHARTKCVISNTACKVASPETLNLDKNPESVNDSDEKRLL
nr:acyl-coenzyme A thioesterase 2, mitochondrial-like [Vicugna pacos]